MSELEFINIAVGILKEVLEDIDWLIHDVLIIKAEALKDKKILAYADALEKNLFMIKKGKEYWSYNYDS